jgi:hypothetical protein
MTDTAIRQALEGVTPSRATLAAALASDSALVLDAAGASDIGLDLTEDGYKAIILTDGTSSATIFVYDDSDTTTVHDGVACLVSSDGKRFKAASPVVWDRYVKSATTTAPPGSPTIGDVYRIPASPTGDWAGQANKLAIRKAAGWTYVTPGKGYFHWVEDTTSFEYWSGAAWAAGLGSSALSNGDITPPKLALPFGLSVENATTATPPGSPSTGVAYLIAASPTGAWAGEAGNVARWNGATWDILDAYEGAQVYDKAESQPRIYNGASWTLSGAGLLKGFDRDMPADGTMSSLTRIANSTANPTAGISQSNSALVHELDAITPKNAGNDITLTISGRISGTVGYPTLALFRDTETAPLATAVYSNDGLHIAGQITDGAAPEFEWTINLSPGDVTTIAQDGDAPDNSDDTSERSYRLRLAYNSPSAVARQFTYIGLTMTYREHQPG